MRKIKNLIIKSNFIRNVAIMATGTAGAQAITILLSPIITRLYGPEAFGILGTFTALTRILMPIAALTFPIAIVLPRSDIEARALIKLSLKISCFLALITAITFVFLNEHISAIFNIQEISSYMYLIPIVIILAGLVQVSEQWLIRKKSFSINAKVEFSNALVLNGGKVGLGLFYPVASILIILQVIALALKAWMMIFFINKKKDKRQSEVNIAEKLETKNLLKKYKDFPIYRTPQVFLAASTEGLPIILLSSFFGPAAAGFYSIGRTVLSLPSKIIGEAIGNVFYPRINEAAQNKENVTKLINKACLGLIATGAIPFGIIILFGPWIFSIAFGSEWVTAGEYARWIALSSFSVFTNKPVVRSIPVFNLQRLHLIYTIVSLIGRAIALLIGFLVFNNEIIAIAFFAITTMFLNIFLHFIVIKRAKKMKFY
ncbi:polysaccharide biosynthesis protein [Oceanobacillus oncorhynchi subsp. incaldanensis]|uniref:lipopolysaccharide biosynthesis protein n=1 Tax=Oceanobacillus oncorhynchi TaxID=545501 RepID=UPI001B0B6E3F|nr:oligosaccharide flippase family protein [Oceanobacillus oncorhynchi]GIO19648.1 polysaccharide biosynthesis protein [Oceanobacillus oncorhynchi subsp. incaldanensis]